MWFILWIKGGREWGKIDDVNTEVCNHCSEWGITFLSECNICFSLYFIMLNVLRFCRSLNFIIGGGDHCHSRRTNNRSYILTLFIHMDLKCVGGKTRPFIQTSCSLLMSKLSWWCKCVYFTVDVAMWMESRLFTLWLSNLLLIVHNE